MEQNNFLDTYLKGISVETVLINYPHGDENYFSFHVRREDLIHPFVSGNKYRKLKYNLIEAHRKNYTKLITFGGAYSNHIAAVAAAGKECGFKTIGIIRGEELANKVDQNPTLRFAKKQGMYLHFVSRNDYRKKEDPGFIDKLHERFGSFYLIPEGGTNALAVQGCEEIMDASSANFDYICVSVGTGGTLAGLVKASLSHQKIIGFSALKGTFQSEVVKKFTPNTNYKIIDSYCFGGYAKIDLELIRFINEFKKSTGIPLDPIYTGKMMFGLVDLLKKGYFEKKSRILAIHTGGLQGITGMNEILKKKNLLLINT